MDGLTFIMVVRCKPLTKDHLPLKTAFSGAKGWSLVTGFTVAWMCVLCVLYSLPIILVLLSSRQRLLGLHIGYSNLAHPNTWTNGTISRKECMDAIDGASHRGAPGESSMSYVELSRLQNHVRALMYRSMQL